jgi:sugar phosphate isomerase/epimerase
MTGLNSLDDEHRKQDLKRFKECIRTAEILDCHRIRAYAGDWNGSDPTAHPEMWHRLVESLRGLGEVALQHGVIVCVENHFNTMTTSARETVRLVAEVSSDGIGALYDQANLTFTHQEGFERAIELQGPWIRHVHVKDVEILDASKSVTSTTVSRVDESGRGHRSRVIGDGQLDWPRIVRRLADVGYTGALSLEYEYRWHPQDLPTPEVGFRTSAARLRSMVAAVDPRSDASRVTSGA